MIGWLSSSAPDVASEVVSGSPAQKPPQPSKPQLPSSLAELGRSAGDGGGEDDVGDSDSCSEDEAFGSAYLGEYDGKDESISDVVPSSEDAMLTAVYPAGEKPYCTAMFWK